MGEQKKQGPTEWPRNPPFEPGKGEELRPVAGPDDDIVFEANDDTAKVGETKKRSKANPKSANDDTARADDDVQHSRTER